MAPSGQRYLQKGRLTITDSSTTASSRANFHWNSAPSAARVFSLTAANGSAPSRIPWGQRYLQKVGSPMPSTLTMRLGSRNSKHHQYPVLEPGERANPPGGELFREGDAVQQILEPAERTEESTDQPSAQAAHYHQEAQYQQGQGVIRGPGQCLHGTDGTAPQCSGTGIAVEPRHTELFQRAFVEFPVQEAGEVGVGHQGPRAPGCQTASGAVFSVLSNAQHTPDTD